MKKILVVLVILFVLYCMYFFVFKSIESPVFDQKESDSIARVSIEIIRRKNQAAKDRALWDSINKYDEQKFKKIDQDIISKNPDHVRSRDSMRSELKRRIEKTISH